MVLSRMEHILHRTLIIRFSSVGDIVLSSLLTRTLRRRFPDCQIDYLVKEEYADLVRHNPHLSRVIVFPSGGTFRDLRRMRAAIRHTRYDLLIDIHDSLRSRFLCFGSSNTVRIRKRKIARFVLLKFRRDIYPWFGGTPSVALRYLEPLAAYGIHDDGEGLEVAVPPALEEAGVSRLRNAGIPAHAMVIGISPSARHATKIWPADRYGAVAASLARDFGAAILLFGGPGEEELCRRVEQRIHTDAPAAQVVNTAGTLTLLETAAVMDRCSLILSNDSGLMHIAAARKRRVVALFGSTTRHFGFFPFGSASEVVEHPALTCRPCTHIGLPACPKGHFKCMEELTSEQVLAAARRLLAA